MTITAPITVAATSYPSLLMAGAARRALLAALAPGLVALALPAAAQQPAPATETSLEEVIVTGSRIARTELTATSPVYTVSDTQIQLDRSLTVEDIFQKLPQAAGGANATGATVGDGLGSSTIDLRGLGQNRTLVLINGTRAVPFSFRNAVDVNAIPAGLIKRVDVLTGGAAAIYGADALAGVVNFVLNDRFEGVELTAGVELPTNGGAEQIEASAIFGAPLAGGRGHVTGYVGYTERQALFAGNRSFTEGTTAFIANEGGNFTDVASGNFFAFDDAGNFTTTRQTVDITDQRFIIQPLKRYNASVFGNYDLIEGKVEFYGRAMFTQMKVKGAGSTGETPVTVNEEVTITQDNPFLPAAAASLLTFDANGEAQVLVERNLGFGMQRTETKRDSFQVQAGLRGDITPAVDWDVYGQFGRVSENAIVFNNGIRRNASGVSKFAAIANTVDIFGPDADLSGLSEPVIHSDRERDQLVVAAVVSGDSSDLFELPAGPVRFALGYEYREETGSQTPSPALRGGLAYGLGGVGDIDARFDVSEFYGELLVPLLSDLPFVQELSVEGAYRTSDFSNTGTFDTNKLGASWAVDNNIRFRVTRQKSIRSPNLGEFAGPETTLSLALFDPTSPSFVPRLGGRFDGDPCLDGRGDAAQCARLGAAAPGTPFDTSAVRYTFGGNPNIQPERGVTWTIGAVITPEMVPGLNVLVDYYDIKITDAVSQIQPIASLTSCFIDNPVADNPLCNAFIRDPNTGLLTQVLVNDLNLANIKQSGFDIGMTYGFDAPAGFGDSVQLSYQATIVTSQSRQNNATVPALDCKGTFGSSCTGDFASILQADYKHRTSIDWSYGPVSVQLGWRRIGSVVNALDRSDTIGAQNYIDLAGIWNISSSLQLTVGVDNLFNEKPEVPQAGGNFFGTLSEFDAIGTSVGAALRYRM